MKKLMIMIGAAATSLGLFADPFVSKTGFEEATAGSALEDLTVLEDESSGATWSATNAEKVDVVKDDSYNGYVPAAKAFTDNGLQYLSIKTALGTGSLTRNFGEKAADGIYADMNVKFTAFDSDAEIPQDAKIAVWVKEAEDGSYTNLIVTAGYVDGMTRTRRDYVVASNFKYDEWHRVTIKAIGNTAAQATAFVVFLDPTLDDQLNPHGYALVSEDDKGTEGWLNGFSDSAKAFAEAGQLFPSMNAGINLSEVAFSGTGDIDSVVVTDVVPFDEAKDKLFYTLTCGENIASFKVGTETITSSKQFLFEGATTVTVTDITPAEGCFVDSDTDEISVEEATDYPVGKAKALAATVTLADGTVVKAASFADAIAAFADQGGTLTLNAATTVVEGSDSLELAQDVVIDLNGKTLDLGEATLTSTASLTIKDETGLGILTAAEEAYALDADVLYVLGGNIMTYATYTTAAELSGGSFIDPEAGAEEFYLKEVVASGKAAVWNTETEMFDIGDAPITTYALTVVEDPNATFVLTVNDEPVNVFPAQVEAGATIVLTAKAKEDYEYAEGANVIETTMPEEALELTVPAPTAIPYVAQIGDKKFLTLAEAAADESAAGATIKLLADVDGFATLSTAASTLDLNGKKIGAYAGQLKITFTGDDAKTVKGGEFGNYKDKITFTVSKDLTITDMTFHQQVDTVAVGAGELVVTGSTFKNDLNTAGTEDISTADTSYSYFSFNLAVGKDFAKSTINGNAFYQARRCCLQLTGLNGPAYVYDNTFDGTKQCLTKDEFTAGRKFGATQIYGQKAPIYIEKNSYSGEWIAEPFTMYNEAANVITTEPVVFNGNTVDATVPYLWVMYMSPDDGGVQTTNMPNIVWGDLSKVAAEVDRTKGQYKAQIDVNPTEVKVANNLALPTGITYCKDFAGDYYVNDAVVEFADIKIGDEVIALPGASLESETLAFKPVTGFKNKFAVEEKPQGPKPTGDGAGSVEPVTDEPGVYVVKGDPSSGNVSIDPASLKPTDTIRVTDSTIGKITGVPAEQIEIKLNGYKIDQKYFVGGDEKGFSLELSNEAKPAFVEATEDVKPFEVGEDAAVTIKAVPGLKYALVRGATVDAITTTVVEAAVATEQTLKLEDTTPKADAAFYKVQVSK